MRDCRAPILPGGHSGGATPVPFPNTEVKTSSADGTSRVTFWESRTPPGNIRRSPLNESSGGFFSPGHEVLFTEHASTARSHLCALTVALGIVAKGNTTMMREWFSASGADNGFCRKR